MSVKSPVMQFIKDSMAALKAHREWKKALNNLKTLEWSTDYVVYLLQTVNSKDVRVTLTNVSGVTLTLDKIPTNYTPSVPYVPPDTVKAFQDYIGATL